MTRLAEENQSVIDHGDVDGYVSASDFSDYMAANLEMSEKTSKNFTVFWNEKHDESNNPQVLLSSSFQSGSSVKEKIKTALQRLGFSKSEYILVQFWALVTIEDLQILTTTDQPFGVTRLRNGLCRYKKICAGNNYGTEGENAGDFLTGPPSRVAQNGFPEYSPNIQFYSSTEFTLRDDAERCKISYYLGLPVFEKSSEFCGVLELVANSGSDVMMKLTHLMKQISAALEDVELRTFDANTLDEKKISIGESHAFREIQRGLREVTRSHYLPFAQTWICSPDSTSTGRATLGATQRSLVAQAGPASGVLSVFGEACNSLGLMKGKGVVWRAFSSQSTCFCADITQLRMTEYPFAHIAKVLGLRSSLAICLQSNHTEDDMYVLEFFLPWYQIRDPRTWLGILESTLKEYLYSFKFVSGQELGEGLKFEVIRSLEDHQTVETSVRQEDSQGQDGTVLLQHWKQEALIPVSDAFPESLPKDLADISNQQASPQLYPYNYPHALEKMFLGDRTDSDAFSEFYADVSDVQSFGGTSNGSNNVVEQNISAPLQHFLGDESIMREYEEVMKFENSLFSLEDTSDIRPGEEGMQAESKSKEKMNHQSAEVVMKLDDASNLEDASDIQPGEEGSQAESKSIEINRQVLEQHFGLKREDAAHALGVSTSTLKRRCREHGIRRWPSRKKKQVTSSPSHNRSDETQTIPDDAPEGLHPTVSTGEVTTSSAGGRTIASAQSFQQSATTNRGSIDNVGITFGSPSSLQAAKVDNGGIMTVKAEYDGKKIKFQLPASSRMEDLMKEIAMRVKLTLGRFEISYLDEDDEWILLTCDEDLRIMESMGKTVIRMLVVNE